MMLKMEEDEDLANLISKMAVCDPPEPVAAPPAKVSSDPNFEKLL